MIPLALFTLAGCVALGPGSDGILGRDLAPALPGLADTTIAISPAPVAGVPRIFRMPELRRLAARFGLSGDPLKELCFARPVAPPDPARFVEAMHRALPQAQLEILDYGRMPAPEGEVEFLLRGLRRAGPDGYWSGSIKYGGGRRFPVWARVKVTVSEPRVVAAENLRPGRAISSAELRLETRAVFPADNAFATSLETVAGRAARLTIAAGEAIRTDWLAAAPDVLRGDRVVVEVHSGGAYLKFEAVAEASGSVGQVIPITNPDSKKRFSARVEGKGRVAVGKSRS
jgi:flagella basal body P-ring formation protein FlgA